MSGLYSDYYAIEQSRESNHAILLSLLPLHAHLHFALPGQLRNLQNSVYYYTPLAIRTVGGWSPDTVQLKIKFPFRIRRTPSSTNTERELYFDLYRIFIGTAQGSEINIAELMTSRST